MGNEFLTFGERLLDLINNDPYIEGKKTVFKLAKSLIDKGYIDIGKASQDSKAHDIERTINIHLNYVDGNKLSGKWLDRYCKYFNCSADYLMGYISVTTHEAKTVQELTGLSDVAIKTLQRINKDGGIATINRLLTDSITSKNIFYTLNSYFTEKLDGEVGNLQSLLFYTDLTKCLDKFAEYERNFTLNGLHRRMLRGDEKDENDDQQEADLLDEIL